MPHPNLDDTQPTPIVKKHDHPVSDQPVSPRSAPQRKFLRRFVVLATSAGALAAIVMIGILAGAASGRAALQQQDAQIRQQALA